MIRCPLSILPAAVVGTAALSIVSAFAIAQGAASKAKPAPPAVHPEARAAAPHPLMTPLWAYATHTK